MNLQLFLYKFHIPLCSLQLNKTCIEICFLRNHVKHTNTQQVKLGIPGNLWHSSKKVRSALLLELNIPGRMI